MERLTGEYFAAIQNIKERQKAFLDYIAGFYNSANRAMTRLGYCVYSALDDSPGCAIGQFLHPELAKECSGSITGISKYYPNKYAEFPDWMISMGLTFLQKVQTLHDAPNFWTGTGLSELGKTEYNIIIKEYNLNQN